MFGFSHLVRIPGLVATFSLFFFEALVLGNWITRIPDIKNSYGFSATQLGICLFVIAMGTLFSFLVGGRAVRRWGLRKVCGISLLCWSLGVGAFPLMPNGILLAPVLFFAGLSVGFVEVGINTSADRLERNSGHRVMSKAHGFWSLGSLVGAVIGAGMASLGISVDIHFLIVMPLCALGGYWLAQGIPVAGETTRQNEITKDAPAINFPRRGIILLCFMPVGIMLVEGAFIDWSALFIRSELKGGPVATGLIYATFSLVMAVTRLGGDRLLARFGPVRVAQLSSVFATIGIGLFALAPTVWVAFFAALFAGAGVAIVYPLAMTAAARRSGEAEDNVAALSLVTFTAFMMAPPIVGIVADIVGLRYALILLVPFAASVFFLSGELKKEG